MHRTQLLLPSELHRRAAEAARVQRTSLGGLVRDALVEYLAKSQRVQPDAAAIDDVLLVQPYVDPTPDPLLSLDADHHLYGAPRRTRSAR